MIPDWQKNQVYISALLERKFPDEYGLMQIALKEAGIHLKSIPHTKDIWARDFMPVQVSKDHFIQFRYDPNYLRGALNLKTIPSQKNYPDHIKVENSNINLDGGNIVCSSNKVILTDRVLDENPNLSKAKIHAELEKLFEAEVFFVPVVKNDMTGHIDGHLRFINEDTVIVNQLNQEYKYWQKGFLKMIESSGLNFVEMPWYLTKISSSAIGSYLNFLQLKNSIIFPIFEENDRLDKKALNIIQNIYSSSTIVPININRIGKMGGLMNCITWTFLS